MTPSCEHHRHPARVLKNERKFQFTFESAAFALHLTFLALYFIQMAPHYYFPFCILFFVRRPAG